MALTIPDDTISSNRTAHTARTLPGEKRAREVSWLPGRHMDRNAAITALVPADATSPGWTDADKSVVSANTEAAE